MEQAMRQLELIAAETGRELGRAEKAIESHYNALTEQQSRAAALDAELVKLNRAIAILGNDENDSEYASEDVT